MADLGTLQNRDGKLLTCDGKLAKSCNCYPPNCQVWQCVDGLAPYEVKVVTDGIVLDPVSGCENVPLANGTYILKTSCPPQGPPDQCATVGAFGTCPNTSVVTGKSHHWWYLDYTEDADFDYVIWVHFCIGPVYGGYPNRGLRVEVGGGAWKKAYPGGSWFGNVQFGLDYGNDDDIPCMAWVDVDLPMCGEILFPGTYCYDPTTATCEVSTV